ncbi:hypothetical protein CDIK_2614 [Cucumispora dikerogammari]|nr:hypothetical protein CDIK_2614 [Cucumispora dikerogammari]
MYLFSSVIFIFISTSMSPTTTYDQNIEHFQKMPLSVELKNLIKFTNTEYFGTTKTCRLRFGKKQPYITCEGLSLPFTLPRIENTSSDASHESFILIPVFKIEHSNKKEIIDLFQETNRFIRLCKIYINLRPFEPFEFCYCGIGDNVVSSISVRDSIVLNLEKTCGKNRSTFVVLYDSDRKHVMLYVAAFINEIVSGANGKDPYSFDAGRLLDNIDKVSFNSIAIELSLNIESIINGKWLFGAETLDNKRLKIKLFLPKNKDDKYNHNLTVKLIKKKKGQETYFEVEKYNRQKLFNEPVIKIEGLDEMSEQILKQYQ